MRNGTGTCWCYRYHECIESTNQGITANVGYKQRREDVSSSQSGTTTRQLRLEDFSASSLSLLSSCNEILKLIAKFNEAHFSQSIISAAAVYCAILKNDIVLRFNVYMFKRTIVQLFGSSFPSSGCEISIKNHTDKNNIEPNCNNTQAKQLIAIDKTWTVSRRLDSRLVTAHCKYISV